MNKKQYNNVIEHTLKHEVSAQTVDSLEVVRAIFNNMGVALPQGDMKHVHEVIQSDDYMGWKSCTMQEAQEAANNGTAAIGISEDRIVVLVANDEEEPVAETASVMTLSENTSAYAVDGLSYATYSNGTTQSIFYKPYDENYPYRINGVPYTFKNAQEYYELLDSYSYELRNDIQFYFTYNEIASLNSYIISYLYEKKTQKEKEQAIENLKILAELAIGSVATGWPAVILNTINIVSTIASISIETVEDELEDFVGCINKFINEEQEGKNVAKTNVICRLSLLKRDPIAGREIKIETSDGLKKLFTLENGTYEVLLMAAMANAHNQILYKIAPDWSYYWE